MFHSSEAGKIKWRVMKSSRQSSHPTRRIPAAAGLNTGRAAAPERLESFLAKPTQISQKAKARLARGDKFLSFLSYRGHLTKPIE